MANIKKETKTENQQPRMNVTKNASKFYVLSIILIVAVILVAVLKGFEVGIQFRQGSFVTYSYSGDIDSNMAQQIANEVIKDDVSIQFGTEMTSNSNTMALTLPLTLDSATIDSLTAVLQEQFPESELTVLSSHNVDRSMGLQFLFKALLALGIAAVVTLLYMAARFRKIGGWSLGIISLIVLLHNAILVFGVFAIAGIPVNNSFIAVALATLVFSLGGMTVLYERIKENNGLLGDGVSPKDLVDISTKQTFPSSLATLCCSVLFVIVIAVVAVVYGASSILYFAVPMIVGLIIGWYSAICLVAPIWASLRGRTEKSNKTSYYSGKTKKKDSSK